MQPERFRGRLGFALCGAAPLTLFSAAPALSQGLNSSNLMGTVPIAIALGAGAFALLALALGRRVLREGNDAQKRSAEQVANLRSMVDDYEALLSGTGEVTVVWGSRSTGTPKFLGPASAVLPSGRRIEAILDFSSWLEDTDAKTLAAKVTDLRHGGQGFDLMFTARDGRQMRAMGWALGAGAAMRVRPTLYQPGQKLPNRSDDIEAAIGQIPDPAVLFGEGRKVVYANAAYQALAKGKTGGVAEIAAAAGMDLVELNLPVGTCRLSKAEGCRNDDCLRQERRSGASQRHHRCADHAHRHLQRQPRAGAVQHRLCVAVAARPQMAEARHGRAGDPRSAAHDGHAASRARLPGVARQAPAILSAEGAARERALVPARRSRRAGDLGTRRSAWRRDLRLRGHHRPAQAQEPGAHADRRAALDAQRADRGRRGVRHQWPADAVQSAAFDAVEAAGQPARDQPAYRPDRSRQSAAALPEDGASLWRDVQARHRRPQPDAHRPAAAASRAPMAACSTMPSRGCPTGRR